MIAQAVIVIFAVVVIFLPIIGFFVLLFFSWLNMLIEKGG